MRTCKAYVSHKKCAHVRHTWHKSRAAGQHIWTHTDDFRLLLRLVTDEDMTEVVMDGADVMGHGPVHWAEG